MLGAGTGVHQIGFRLHAFNPIFKLFKPDKRLRAIEATQVLLSAFPLLSMDMTLDEQALFFADGSEFVFQLGNILLILTNQGITLGAFFLQRGAAFGIATPLYEGLTRQVFASFVYCELGLLAPLVGPCFDGLAVALDFLFCGHRPGAGGFDLNQRILHFLDHEPNELLRVFRLIKHGVEVGADNVTDSGENSHAASPLLSVHLGIQHLVCQFRKSFGFNHL